MRIDRRGRNGTIWHVDNLMRLEKVKESDAGHNTIAVWVRPSEVWSQLRPVAVLLGRGNRWQRAHACEPWVGAKFIFHNFFLPLQLPSVTPVLKLAA